MPNLHRSKRGHFITACNEQGSSLVETALLLPVFVLLLVIAVDFGRAYSASIIVNSAAQNGALYGVQNPNDVAGMVLAAKLDNSSPLLVVPTASFGCECADGTAAVVACTQQPSCTATVVNYVEVDTSAVYVPLMPYPGVPASIVLNGKARLRAAQ